MFRSVRFCRFWPPLTFLEQPGSVGVDPMHDEDGHANDYDEQEDMMMMTMRRTSMMIMMTMLLIADALGKRWHFWQRPK